MLLLVALLATVFACKEKAKRTSELTVEQLALKFVNESVDGEEDNAAIASALLSLLQRAGLENAEIRATLLALDESEDDFSAALSDLVGTFQSEHSAQYYAFLRVIGRTVSPEYAGVVFYTARNDGSTTLPYTLEDCRKIATLLFSQDAAFGSDMLEDYLEEGYTTANERQVTTFLLSFSAALQKAVGLSASAKEYLYSLMENGLENVLPEDLATELDPAIVTQGTGILLKLAACLRDSYDVSLGYAAAYLSAADARLLLGLPYEKKESTLYYGYYYEDWQMVPLSKEDYEARVGDYDEHLTKTSTNKGFTVKGEFLPFSEKEVALAERVYRLDLAYRAYQTLTAEEQTAFRTALPAFLNILGEEQAFVAALLDRPVLQEESDLVAADLDELLTALSAIGSFDATDGISTEERAVATQASEVFERYLHGYLPKIY